MVLVDLTMDKPNISSHFATQPLLLMTLTQTALEQEGQDGPGWLT